MLLDFIVPVTSTPTRTHWSVISLTSVLSPRQNFLPFENYNFVHTSSHQLFKELRDVRRTVQLHTSQSTKWGYTKTNPLFNFHMRSKMWHLLTLRRFSAFKTPEPFVPNNLQTSYHTPSRPASFSIKSSLLHQSTHAIQGVYFPLYNRELRLDNRWQVVGIQFKKLRRNNLLTFSSPQGRGSAKLRKSNLLHILRLLLTHFTPTLRTYVFGQEDEISWTHLLKGALANTQKQYFSTRPRFRPKRAFNWFKERPYLFLNRRPTFKAKLDWILRSTLFGTFLAYKNTIKRFNMHWNRRLDTHRESQKRRRFFKRAKLTKIHRLRYKPLRFYKHRVAIPKAPRFIYGSAEQHTKTIGISMKLRKTFLNNSVVTNKSTTLPLTHFTKVGFVSVKDRILLLFTKLYNTRPRLNRWLYAVANREWNWTNEALASNIPPVAEKVRLKVRRKKHPRFRSLTDLNRDLRLTTFRSNLHAKQRYKLHNREPVYLTERYLFKLKRFKNVATPTTFVQKSIVRHFYFNNGVQAVNPHMLPPKRRRRFTRKFKRFLRKHLFNFSAITERLLNWRYARSWGKVVVARYDNPQPRKYARTPTPLRNFSLYNMYKSIYRTGVNKNNKAIVAKSDKTIAKLLRRQRSYRRWYTGSFVLNWARRNWIEGSRHVPVAPETLLQSFRPAQQQLHYTKNFYPLLQFNRNMMQAPTPVLPNWLKANWISKLWLVSTHKISFTLNSYAFTYINRINDPSCNTFLGRHFPIFKYRKHMHSFMYLNELKRYILRRHRVSIRHFSRTRYNHVNRVTTFRRFLYLHRRGNRLNLRQAVSGQYFRTNLDRSFVDRDPRRVRVKRVRFKPGYSRIWRNVRAALQESLNLSFRYQHRLTAYLPQFYKLTKFQSLYGLEMRLSSILIYTNLVPDYEFSKYFITNGLVYINGRYVDKPEMSVVLNDFIQLIVSLKYYIANRWLSGWKIKKHLRLKKLSNAKYNNQSRRRMDKQVSTRLPSWIYQHKYKYYDIPNYLEVDYFTLSAFMIYDPFLVTDFNPTNSREFRVAIYKNYNWKYIT